MSQFGEPSEYTKAGLSAAAEGHLDDAQALFWEAVERYPSNFWLLYQCADMAMRRKDFSDAERLWTLARERFPDEPSGHLGWGRLLLERREISQAEALFSQIIERFPDFLWGYQQYAHIPRIRRDWEEAAVRCARFREKFPHEPVAQMDEAIALADIGRVEEGEILLASIIEGAPDNLWARHHHADFAARRRDWPEATRRWSIVRERFPNHSVPDYVADIESRLSEPPHSRTADGPTRDPFQKLGRRFGAVRR